MTQQSVRVNNFADSLSQYSKHSDELGMGSELIDKQTKVSAIYSTKKTSTEKMAGKAQKKLPEIN